MTEMAVGVVLRADASGLVGQLRQARGELETLAGSARSTGGAFDAGRAAGRDYTDMAQKLRAAIYPTYAAQKQFDDELAAASRLLKAGFIAQSEFNDAQAQARQRLQDTIGALKQSNSTIDAQTKNLGLQKAGWFSVGQQLQDVFASYSTGTRLTTIFAQQSGQLSTAISMIAQSSGQTEGKLGALTRFLGGGWGIALGVAVSAIGPLVSKLFETEDASKKSESATRTFAEVMKDSKASWEEVTKAADDYVATQKRAREITLLTTKAEAEGVATKLNDALALREKLKVEMELMKFQLANTPGQYGLSGAAIAAAQSGISDRIAENDNAIPKLTAAAEEAVRKAATITAKVQTDLATRLTTGFEVMRDHVLNSTKGFDAQVKALATINRQEAAVNEAGKNQSSRSRGPSAAEQANVGEMSALLQQLLPGVRITSTTGGKHTNGSDHYVGRAIDFVPAGGMRAISKAELREILVEAGVQIRRNASGVEQLFGPGDKGHSDHFHVAWTGKVDVDKVMERANREAERFDDLMAKGASQAEAVLVGMTGSIDYLARGVDVAGDFNSAMADMTKASDANFAAWQRTQDETAAVLDNIIGMTRTLDGLGGAGSMLGDLGAMVVGLTSGDFSGVGGKLGSLFDLSPALRGMATEFGARLDKVFGGAEGDGTFAKTMAKVLQSAGVGVASSTLVLGQKGNNLGAAVGGVLGQSLGQAVGPAIGKAIGGSLGSALGSAAGPLGSIAGGILGGLVGSVFGKKIKGSSSVNQDGVNTSANDSQVTSNLNSMGGQLQSAIAQIASRLGGQVGSYDVGFGQYKDYYQVSGSGSGSDKYLGQTNYNKKSGAALYDGKDAAAALSAAIQNAVADGAIKGVSAAVAKALKSSPDIDKALAEALKVQDVEMALGGIGAQLQKAFRDFETQASERLRIAKQYGFDVVAMEKRNAEDRLKLTQQLAADQIGSLQKLIDAMTGGSLFEGSATDHRTVLLDQIAKAKAEVDAGVAGAADTLANLYEQLNSVSKEVYGTTGGFATDRAAILSGASDTIAKANERIAAAQTAAASDPALTTTNAALDENNAQNAQIITALGITNAQLQAMIAAGSGVSYAGLASLAATS